ncbi:hypothetical protein HDZ31DRAFT_69145 [Schizophyllum fasciatum]
MAAMLRTTRIRDARGVTWPEGLESWPPLLAPHPRGPLNIPSRIFGTFVAASR